jgi:hypothetical protein
MLEDLQVRIPMSDFSSPSSWGNFVRRGGVLAPGLVLTY